MTFQVATCGKPRGTKQSSTERRTKIGANAAVMQICRQKEQDQALLAGGEEIPV